MLQGAQESRITTENHITTKEKLQEFNIDFEEYIFEDEGHGILRVKNQKFLYKLIADFFEKSL